jgi:AcrR family transcriptional regulator
VSASTAPWSLALEVTRIVPRPRSPRLSRDRIIECAIEIIDAEGLDALSTRRLATELNVQAPSLYNHFATKEEILDEVADALYEKVDLSMLGQDPWPAALREWARGYRRVLVAHPNIVPILARGPGRRPAQLRVADAVYGALVDAGWPPSYATRIGALMRYLVTGSALGSFAQGFPDDPSLYGDAYPHLGDAHRLRKHQAEVDEGAFELGLASIIASLERTFAEVRLPGSGGSAGSASASGPGRLGGAGRSGGAGRLGGAGRSSGGPTRSAASDAALASDQAASPASGSVAPSPASGSVAPYPDSSSVAPPDSDRWNQPRIRRRSL